MNLIFRYRNWVKRSTYHVWGVIASLLFFCAFYYSPLLTGLLGLKHAQLILFGFHNFYGIDFFGILLFIPVVYAAFIFGVHWTVAIAFSTTALIIPYSLMYEAYPGVLLKPTAFAIILSAVGAVIAMIQKSDLQKWQNARELQCLYDIGVAAEQSFSIQDLLIATVRLIPQAMPYPDSTGISITAGDIIATTPGYENLPDIHTEDLISGSELLGKIRFRCSRRRMYLIQSRVLKTMAERISGAIREIELKQSLKKHFDGLEEMIEKRTHDLEQVQAKLIRTERLAAVGELASSVGHELRNPLNVIRNCVYLLHMNITDKDCSDTKNTLATIDRQIDIANRIVTDLLEFTVIRRSSPSVSQIGKLIQESLSCVKIPQNVSLDIRFNQNTPEIYADNEQIRRVFTNIITNAFQAMNSENGILEIETGEDSGMSWVKFKDTGCGIPPENLDKIFEPLFTTKPKGIGLGLAITRRLVEQNNGKIDVQSRIDYGTTFTITLPQTKGK